MRMRRKKNFDTRLEACQSYLIQASGKGPDGFSEIFPNHNPIHLEIGCGRGRFLSGHAQLRPNVNFVGLEKFDTALLLAMEKAAAAQLPNIRFLNCDARLIGDIFAPHSIDTIYLNFSDPWPKNTYAKNRLTHPNFLALYKVILKEDGHLFFKTDNSGLFAFSRNSFLDTGFQIINETNDLHNSDISGNIMTEYEAKFHSYGMPIFYLDVALEG